MGQLAVIRQQQQSLSILIQTPHRRKAVAALLLDMEGREAAVKSVTRGDTAVTYAVSDGQSAALAGLAPWRRLGRLKEG